jgi:beta-glucanase (GH16 family)
MKARHSFSVFLPFLLLLMLCASPLAQAQNWQLVWQDEFRGSIGPDWVFETGAGGWGNNELQYYRRENATVENDALVITARREDFGGARYTSARMKTQGRKTFNFGRIEARIALPGKQGVWPAFWALGSNISSVGWPASGEIDIMEQINTSDNILGTVHWQGSSGNHAQYGGSTTTSVVDYHVYAVEWSLESIRWFVDGRQFHVIDITNGIGGTEEFQRDFFLLLNMAVGGNLPGFNIDDRALPARMLVDYVRVYQLGAAPAPAVKSWTGEFTAGKVIRHQGSRGRVDAVAGLSPIADGNWKMVPGLAGGGVSFQSQNYPSRYLRHRHGEVWLDPDDGSALFRVDATFNARPGQANGNATSFESWNFPGRYLRHRNSLLYVENLFTDLDRRDATFASGPELTTAPPTAGTTILLEAETYAVMQGMLAEACSEGSQNLGYIDAHDWVVWDVTVPRSGTYTVQYRVASLGGGGVLQLERAGGGPIYGSLGVPATGGWQNWTTVYQQVHLTAGPQQIAVKALAGGWNLNWVKLSQ